MKLLYNYTKRILLILTLFILPISMYAQKAANNLYNKGIAAQKIMTIESQEEAIDFFTKAKKAYDSKANKAKCDAAIAKSEENKKNLVPDVLAIDTESLNFMDVSAPGYINVNTNREDWSVKLKSTEGGSDFAVAKKTEDGRQIKITCLDNKTYQNRTAIFEVTAGKLTKEIVVEQKGLHVNFAVQTGMTSIECKKKGGSVSVIVGSDSKETYGENNSLNWHVISKPDWADVSGSLKKAKENLWDRIDRIFKGTDESLVANGVISEANIMILRIDKNSDEYATGRIGEVILESGNKQITIKLLQK